MRSLALRLAVPLACLLAAVPAPARADDEPPADSPYVRLLKSGKLPPERFGVAIGGIGQRGGPADLAYLLKRAIDPAGFPPAVRVQALDALADATQNRQARPSGGVADLPRILEEDRADASLLRPALRLVGLWKVQEAAPAARALAANARRDLASRAAALDALAALGSPADRLAIETVATDQDPAVAARAVAALARIDVGAAAARAARSIADAAPAQDLAPLLAAFVDLRGGAEKLAEALRKQPPPADAAKLALRSLHAIGHAEESLVSVLSEAAHIATEARALSADEMAKLVAEVASQGDPARGESVFRRPELNCAKCHSIGAAGGGVGPDLSAVGVSSPVDYLVNSILLPDLAIKEVYDTLMVLTEDGRIFQGIVVEKDDQKIVLRDATAEVRTIPTASVEETKPGGSLMPKGLANLMTHAEFVDLVRFLSELGKPGPYAVQSTPTVHRWRVLGEASGEELAGEAKLPASDDPRWLPIYSRAGGDLPLDEARALARTSRIVVRAELVASAGGPARVRLGSWKGVTAMLDDRPIPANGDGSIEITPGRHALTFALGTPEHTAPTLRVEVERAPGSAVEFALVVGK